MTDDELFDPGFQVHMRHAAAFRRRVLEKTVTDAGIAVAGAPIVQSARNRGARPTCHRGSGHRSDAGSVGFVARSHVEDVTDEAVPLAVVPDHLRSEPGSHWSMQPCCQHQARVSPSGIQRSLVVQVDHADRDDVVGRGERCSKATSMPST